MTSISNIPKVMGISPPTRKNCLYSKKVVDCRGMLKSPLMAKSMDLNRSSAPPFVRLLTISEYCNSSVKIVYILT